MSWTEINPCLRGEFPQEQVSLDKNDLESQLQHESTHGPVSTVVLCQSTPPTVPTADYREY